jgi:hypothetical protein
MRKISLWAKHHPWLARIIIIVSFIVLNVLGFTTGLLLHDASIFLPVAALLFFICLYATGFIAYPFKNENRKYRTVASRYVRQKTCDILLAGSTFLMIVYLGNHKEILFRYSFPFNEALASNTILPGDSAVKTYKSIAAFSSFMKDANGKSLTWKERKKILKEQVRVIKKADDLTDGAKAALIVLSVLVALGLLYLIGVLACSLSCGGSDVAAIIVAIGGAGLVIFLLIVVIRKILKKKNLDKKPDKNKSAIIQEAPAEAAGTQ